MEEELTPEDEAAIDAFAVEVSTAFVDALFIKAGLIDEPTTELGREAYRKALSK